MASFVCSDFDVLSVNMKTSAWYPTVFFEHLPPIANALIFLDIDGTLLPDGDREIEQAVRDRLHALTVTNIVYLATNSRNQERKQRLQKELGIPLTPTAHKKPWKTVLTGIDTSGKDMVVIGDKFLTDYVFAKQIHARCILVQRKRSYRERLMIRFIYLFDGVCAKLVSFFI